MQPGGGPAALVLVDMAQYVPAAGATAPAATGTAGVAPGAFHMPLKGAAVPAATGTHTQTLPAIGTLEPAGTGMMDGP